MGLTEIMHLQCLAQWCAYSKHSIKSSYYCKQCLKETKGHLLLLICVSGRTCLSSAQPACLVPVMRISLTLSPFPLSYLKMKYIILLFFFFFTVWYFFYPWWSYKCLNPISQGSLQNCLKQITDPPGDFFHPG